MRGWPTEPYKGLQFYTDEDEPLFAGRDDDIKACVSLITAVKTSTLILHGSSGCGKSSFLRAGVIPALERLQRPIMFLRSASGEPIAIRCTAQPVDRIAEEIFEFTQRPLTVPTAEGSDTYDLSKVRMGHEDLGSFKTFCRTAENLVGVLRTLSEEFSHTVILILDQAEEIISLRDADRKTFFNFFKLFNARPLRVKLIVSLRTENFGEFFRFMNFEASIFTDVKQYLLEKLSRKALRDAIELPTLRTPVRGLAAPYDRYQFDFEDGLIDRILKDLFEANPTGGILPAAQIVCRDLFNEIKNTRPSQITRERYDTGGGIVRRVDNHISRSLRAAFQSGGISTQDFDKQETRWRKALSRLAIYSPDGTVRSDVRSEVDVVNQLKAAMIGGNIEAILFCLKEAETLVLRQISVFAPGSGDTQEMLSLAHDSIGLALRQWGIRQDEIIKRQQLEIEFKQRRRRTVRIAAVMCFGLLVAAIAVLWFQRFEKGQDAKTLQVIASRTFYDNIGTTSAVLLGSLRKAREAVLFPRDPPDTLKDLTELRIALPVQTIESNFKGSNVSKSSVVSRVLPKSQQVVFWSGRDGLEMVSLDPKVKPERIPLSDLQKLGLIKGSVLRSMSEVGPGAFLLLFKTPRNAAPANAPLVLAVIDAKPTQVADVSKFAPNYNPASDAIILGDGVIYAWQKSRRVVQAFFLDKDQSRPNAPPVFFSPRDHELTALVDFFMTGPNAKLLAIVKTSADSSSNILKYGTSPMTIVAYDFSAAPVLTAWEFEARSNATIKACYNTQTARCTVAGSGSDFFVLNVHEAGETSEPGVDTKPSDTDTYLIVDKTSGRASEFRRGDFLAATRVGLNAIPADSNPAFYFAGESKNPYILIPDHSGIRVVKLDKGKPNFRGTAASTAFIPSFRMSSDEHNLISYGDGSVNVWDISRIADLLPKDAKTQLGNGSQKGWVSKVTDRILKVTDFLFRDSNAQPGDDLQKELCKRGVVADLTGMTAGLNGTDWLHFLSHDDKPIDLCAGNL